MTGVCELPDRFDKKIIEAKALEERLIAENRHLDAQIIGRLRKAARATHNTLKLVHQDNMQLAERIKELEAASSDPCEESR